LRLEINFQLLEQFCLSFRQASCDVLHIGLVGRLELRGSEDGRAQFPFPRSLHWRGRTGFGVSP
jgi:hypothetical protein